LSDQPSRILALDLGATSGWCFGARGGDPRFGIFTLPGPGSRSGARFGPLANMCGDLIRRHQPTLVIKEAPMRFRAQNSAHTARQQYGYHAIVEDACWRNEVPLIEEEVDTIRKAIIGLCRVRKGHDIKDVCLRWCRDHGFQVRQADQADAVITWLWACEHRSDGRFVA
jgi:hypothetical protein